MNKVSIFAFKKNLINLKNNWSENKFDPSFYFKFLIVLGFSPLLIVVSLTDDLEASMAKKSIFKKGLLKSALKKIENTDTVYFNYEPIINQMALDGKSQTAGIQVMLLPNEEVYLFKKDEYTGKINMKKTNVYQLEKEEHGYAILLSYLIKKQSIVKMNQVVNYLESKLDKNKIDTRFVEQMKESLLVNQEKNILEKSMLSGSTETIVKAKRKNKI